MRSPRGSATCWPGRRVAVDGDHAATQGAEAADGHLLAQFTRLPSRHQGAGKEVAGMGMAARVCGASDLLPDGPC